MIMQMKVSEVLDRWTILRMKARYDENAKKELALYDAEVIALISSDLASVQKGSAPRACSHTFWSIILDLMEANAKTWENEAAIRKEYSNDPAAGKKNVEQDLEEVGRRALAIRGFNKLRVEAKTKIDKLFGELPDLKVNHASQ